MKSVSRVKEGYPRTKKVIEQSMKIVQRELEDGRLKVDILSDLLSIKEKLENDGSREE
jgi:hypothetical protein